MEIMPMKIQTRTELVSFVQSIIREFHNTKLASLEIVSVQDILKRKNPYLYKAKGIQSARDLVKYLLDAYLSSQEETLFGAVLEQLAVFISERESGGRKSTTEGIDLEFNRGSKHYIITIKSGPNWGNSSQIKKMELDFTKAIKVYKTNNPHGIEVVAINGCCYGRDDKPEKGKYQKLCGQRFWEFLSGDPDMYQAIVEPIGHDARTRNDEFQKNYEKLIDQFMIVVMNEFYSDGALDWSKIVQFNSAKGAVLRPKGRGGK